MYYRKKRTRDKTRKRAKRTPRFAPYKSTLEKRIATKLSTEYVYEPKDTSVDYTISHKYKPDFVHPKYPDVLIEVKGYFRTSAEAAKYIAVKKDNPKLEIIFIFNNSFKKAHPNCRTRVDGSIMTLREWCHKNNFLYYDEKEIPDAILEGKVTKKWILSQRRERGLSC